MHTQNINLLTIKNLSIKINNLTLISNLNIKINAGDKIAVIGEEGNGKSTLLSLISNQQLFLPFTYQGQINISAKKIGYLLQTTPEKIKKFSPLELFIFNELENVNNWEKYNEINYIHECLQQVNLDKNIIEQNTPIKNLSGGEQIKLQLAKIIFNKPDFLLLDEPTNNLDIETLTWLEKYIKSTSLACLFVSHDIHLLSQAATHILHLEKIHRKSLSQYTFIKSSYADYIQTRNKRINWENNESSRQKRKYESQRKKLLSVKDKVRQDQENILSSFTRRLLNKKMKNILSQQTKLEKQELLKKPDPEEAIQFSFDSNIKIHRHKIIARLKIKNLSIENKTLIKNISLNISGPAKICFIGPNGSGKSTLLNKLFSHIQKTTGQTPGYFPQDYANFFTKAQNTLEYLTSDYQLDQTTAQSILGQLKFTPEEMFSPPNKLSGGQQAKLILCCLSLSKKEILILDEPTSNLSPLSIPILIQALQKFQGCLITTSHDREFIAKIFTDIYQINNQQLIKISNPEKIV